jgi:serine/threonine protein kinase
MYDDAVLQRIQSERQSLALMDHPSIANVFDAGATPDGQPYFVMEFVPGLSITDYCDQKKMKIRERLELLIKACEGVQQAHQKAVMHRGGGISGALHIRIWRRSGWARLCRRPSKD